MAREKDKKMKRFFAQWEMSSIDIYGSSGAICFVKRLYFRHKEPECLLLAFNLGDKFLSFGQQVQIYDK